MVDPPQNSQSVAAPHEHTTPDAPAPTGLAAKAKDLESIRDAMVSASGVNAGLWLSYLFVLFYLLVAVGGVTHKDLFLETPVKLPFLSIDLPLRGFFWLGPAIFLIMHAHVLLHFRIFAAKAHVFDSELRAQVDPGQKESEIRDRLRGQLPNDIFIQFLAGPRENRTGLSGRLLKLIARISLVTGPVALLVFFQLKFLPFQDELITWWHRIIILLDLLLIWLLWSKIFPKPHNWLRRRVRLGWKAFGITLLLFFVFFIAIFPDEWLEREFSSVPFRVAFVGQPIRGPPGLLSKGPEGLLDNRIALRAFDVIDHSKFDNEAKIAALPVTASVRDRNFRGAMLMDAVLRKVDFTRADLTGAILLGAQLQKANLNRAQLWDASLLMARLQGADLSYTQLQAAELDSARLDGANLSQTQLQGASLIAAQLHGADLHLAQLQGADLSSAQLQGADLSNALLDGATLNFAQLQGASLRGALLQGASLWHVFAWRADISETVLQPALVANVILEPKFSYWRCDSPDPSGDQSQREASHNASGMSALSGEVVNSCREIEEDWTETSLRNFRYWIEQVVPAGGKRVAALNRLGLQLDPSKPLKDEAARRQRWRTWQGSPQEPSPACDFLLRSTYKKLRGIAEAPYEDASRTQIGQREQRCFQAMDSHSQLKSEQLRRIGCSIVGAPYVVNALSLRVQRDVWDTRTAAALLNPACEGARNMSEEARQTLEEVREVRASVPANRPPSK
jgi:uncharacterized protein YjbI with pentapeptide repeats